MVGGLLATTWTGLTKTLGATYPYAHELEEAENRLYAMMLLCAAPQTMLPSEQ